MDIEDFLAHHSIQVFKKQSDAIEHQQAADDDARLFSFESQHLSEGCRRFICISLQKFYEFYTQQRSALHFYEVIQDGRPCRAYFDLEYQKQCNDSLNPMSCLFDFINLCQEAFQDVLSIHLSTSNFLVLDSSTDAKFSAHVIVHLPDNFLFANNLVLKLFVDKITTRMAKQHRCMVMKEDGKLTFLCDNSVYTRNRNFRLYYSSKRGKTARFEYASYCSFYPRRPFDNIVFYDALILPVNFKNCPLIQASNLSSKAGIDDFVKTDYDAVNLTTDNEVAETDQPPSRLQTVVLDSELFSATQDAKSMQSSSQVQQPKLKSTSVRDLKKATGVSPFPDLDRWFIALIRENFPKASIRLWTLSYVDAYNRRQIQYALNNCRFCHNIKREHKRQNVYWIINLEEFYAYQRCFDIDCRGFTSESYPLSERIQEKCRVLIDKEFKKYGIELTSGIKDENRRPQANVDDDDDVTILVDVPPKKIPRTSR